MLKKQIIAEVEVMAIDPILSIQHLRTSFFTDEGEVPAVDDISLDIYPSEIVGIVGESGCGKSVTSLSIMGLVPHPPGENCLRQHLPGLGKIWFRLPKDACVKSGAMSWP